MRPKDIMPTVRSELFLSILVMFFNNSLDAAFIEEPSTSTVPANAEAIFRCRHQTADSISWLINGTSILSISNPDITPSTINDENNNRVNTLSIVARPQYNHTKVECVATFFDDSQPVRSPAVMLIIVQDIIIPINDTYPPTSTSEPENGFIEVPLPVIVAVGDEAVFRCQHAHANAIEWNINGTSLSDFHPLNITQMIPLSSSETYTLSIQALASYNQTSVECVAFLDTTRLQREESSSVLLFIQGPLLSITNLMIRNSSLEWEAPFTLNLTNAHPDIVYCVDVYNVSCADRQHLVSDCSLTEPTYRYYPQTDIILEYVVVPRSNVQNARNGTPQVLTEEYLFFNASTFTPIITKSDNKINLCLKYNYDVANNTSQRTLDSYTIQLESVDAAQPTSVEYISSDTQTTENGIAIHFNDTFEQRRIWSYIVKGLACGGITLSNPGQISTHELQRLEVHQSQNGIMISSEILNGSRTSGMFIVAYSLAEDSNLHYSIHPRLNNQQGMVAEVEGLSGNRYNVSIFSLENGIPFKRAAAQPKSVDLSNSEGVPVSQRTTAILSCVYINNTFTETACINCIFTNDFDGTCVAISHLKTSLLVNSSHGLTDINVNFLNRSLDSRRCSGCIDGISNNNYAVAVFAYQEHVGIIGPPTTLHSSIYKSAEYSQTFWQILLISVLTTTIVLIMLVILFVTTIVIVKSRKKVNSARQDIKIKVKVCDAYTATNFARKLERMDPNPAYEVVKACDSCAIKVKECPAYKATRTSMPMEQNPSYGELGHTIYETIS